MNIIYVSCLASNNKYRQLFDGVKNKPGQQVQKYHRLMAEGFVQNESINVKTVSALPINRLNYNKLFYKFDREIEKNIQYNYLPIINVPFIKNVFIFLMSFFYTIFLCWKNRDSSIVCDVLNISVTTGAIFAAKILGIKNIGIVTDVPNLLNSSKGISLKINNFIIKRFSSYVFLTEQMNQLINTKNRPYRVIEGLVDMEMKEVENILDNKNKIKVCIYSGGLQNIYGIRYLCHAFIKANISECELHIYGSGDFEEELIEICNEYENIKYFGTVLNEIVVKEQIKATLLINPRPSNEEYTKYSFPSKNMEYMVSGTPVLTTNLPGMPEEYKEHVYIIENETIDGLAKSLKQILIKSEKELHQKGQSAKLFVLNKKNNIVQTSKIIEQLKNMG